MKVVEVGDPDEASDMALALEVGNELNRAYPDHPWMVSFQGRALVVRHLAIANAVACGIGREGFGALLPREKLGTPKEVARTAMEFGGQLLEAFGLRRGPWDGTTPTVPKHWKMRQESHFG